jgi:hypothetical protein
MRSICNFGYAPTKKGGPRFPDVRGLLRYIQYRDDRDDHIPGAGGPDRWVDGGLGDSYPKILARLDQLSPANRFAYCHAVVVSPDPEAMAEVEGDPHSRFVEAVKASIAEWEEWRQEHDRHPQVGPIEYAFVVHRPERNYGEQMHAHLILAPASEHPPSGNTTPLYNNKREIEAFKEITYRQLDRVFGLDREREQPEPEHEPGWQTFGPVFDREREFIPFHRDETIGDLEA